MAKSRKKFNYTIIFPILFFLFPFFIFLIFSFIRFLNTGLFNYTNNFLHFYNVIKNFKEYIFPSIVFLTVGLIIVIFNKIINKKLRFINWFFITLLGIIIILIGNRTLFIITNNLWSEDFFEFIFNGINLYSFIFASELCFLVCAILNYFDIKYLKK